jgi:hypothetical protein
MQNAIFRIRIADSAPYVSVTLNTRLFTDSISSSIYDGYILKGENIVLDASDSGVFINGVKDETEIVTYRWICSSWLEDYCDS